MSVKTWSARHTTDTAEISKFGILPLCVFASVFAVIAVLFVKSMQYAREATARNRAVLAMVKVAESLQKFKDAKGSAAAPSGAGETAAKTETPSPPAVEGNPPTNVFPVSASTEETVVETKGPLLAALLSRMTPDDPNSSFFLDLPETLGPKEHAIQNPAGEWELHDPWGNFFRIHVDLNGDGKIPNPAQGEKPAAAPVMPPGFIIYSAGPDGNFATWKDNICSWR